jgi:hypothetical protein
MPDLRDHQMQQCQLRAEEKRMTTEVQTALECEDH